MPDKELETKLSKPMVKPPPIASQHPTMEQLNAMKTEDLVKMLLSHDMDKPANAVLRQQIIKILQERKGNAFVQSLLKEKTSGGK
jgi:hypothetical protein